MEPKKRIKILQNIILALTLVCSIIYIKYQKNLALILILHFCCRISKMAPAARRLYAKGVFTGFKRGKLQSKYQQSRRKLFLKTLILLRFHFDLNCHKKYLIFSFKGLRNQHENTALVKVEGCANKDDSKWYIGKRCAYVYRVSPNTNLIEFSCYHWVFILNSREAIY